MKSINVNNYEETLWFSLIHHDCFCEFRVPRHVVLYIQSGRFEVRKGSKTVTAYPGQYIFVRRDCGASIAKLSDDDTPYQSIAITLERPFLKDHYNRHQGSIQALDRYHETPIEECALILEPTLELRSLFQSLVPYQQEQLNPTPELLNRKLDEAVWALIGADRRLAPTLFDFRETWKIDLLEFMELNFTHDLSMEEFASYSGRSLSTFKRDFAKISPTTPQRWLQAKRLDRAKELVSTGQSRPSDVYLAVGFRNRSHFATAFKQRFGCTPSSLSPAI